MPAAESSIRIFGGVLVPGAYEVALLRILAAYRLYDPAITDRVWQHERAIAAPRPPAPPGKRLWFRNDSEQHGIGGFISTDPGEFRSEPPSGPDDVIVDPPATDGSVSLGGVLWQTLQASQDASVGQSATLKRLQQMAHRVLAEDATPSAPGAVSEAIQMFQLAQQKGVQGPGDDWNGIVHALFETCLFDARMASTTFALCLTLLQMQAMTGLWISDPGLYEKPFPFLQGFVQNLSASPDRSRLVEVLRMIGAGAYSSANTSVQSALQSHSLATANRSLVLACSNFFTATIIAKLNDAFALGAALPYTEVLAEEGFCCCTSGLRGGLDFFLLTPAETIEIIADQLSQGDIVPAVVRRLASTVFPVFPKWFARTLVGAAQCSTPGPAFDSGLKLLLTLEQELAKDPTANYSFESSWLDQLLLSAYSAAGDEAHAKQYAVRIATRLVFDQALLGLVEGTSTG